MSLTVAPHEAAASADPWMTPSYCSACHPNHPGPCDCSCHRSQGVIRDYWLAALKYCAIGRTAADLRAQAADPEMTRGLALLSGISEEQERAQVLAVAPAIDLLAAAGLTPVKCWYLAGLDQFHGPYADNAALARMPEVAA